ncbi:MAG: glycosyltransferase family 4 protein, partial [Verrucomicrobiota bacterium]|nr:glycosyltransferase family 4 protein [Verrucomicrobiota bacterium]
MNLIQITPGAGPMFCGGCFRDNALVAALRKLGHATTMVPLYLPLTLDEENQSAGTPIFFSGINVYLGEKSAFFRRAPEFLRKCFASPTLLNSAANFASKTRPQDLGDLTLSMLRGEEGNQTRELDELISWLKKNGKPDLISLSNALLIGLARKLKRELKVPVVCSLQGEDFFLNSLLADYREKAWKLLAQRAVDVDLFIAPSIYFASVMRERLNFPSRKIKVVWNGINLQGFENRIPNPESRIPNPVIGFFARLCQEKGLPALVDAYIEIRKRNRVTNLKLKIGGSFGPADEPLVNKQKEKLRGAGVLAEVEFHPNLNRQDKIKFLKSLTVFSVPAFYGEAFGLYVIEALAAGVPVVQPRHAAFPELIEATSGGILYEPGDFVALADSLEELLLNPEKV